MLTEAMRGENPRGGSAMPAEFRDLQPKCRRLRRISQEQISQQAKRIGCFFPAGIPLEAAPKGIGHRLPETWRAPALPWLRCVTCFPI
ncbi:hypothetical protein E0493_07955 [Roseomonas sp. M0104]|uniref:Uncharacterized protein n=1 Tax=Teichococcus coralli TaxID=2545983 RepID=A0A845B956_9PROT|nr:hypothetical protein [Pseudoroseomonas coralli]MXP63285.1 hypothetical protein [Pseudoroseomonas coralli]